MYGTLNVAKTTGISIVSKRCLFSKLLVQHEHLSRILSQQYRELHHHPKWMGKRRCVFAEKGGRLTFRSWYRNDAYDEMSSPDTIP